jgi:hypothetical protein
VRGLNSLNYDYLKLKKEEVIYKGSVCTNTRVLPLHTAYASRASARDHVTWNATARTVTIILYAQIVIILLMLISPRLGY